MGRSEVEQQTQSRMLRDLLENATGEPEHVVAVNLDVRGFSSFCERNESANVVVFIREAYKRLIDRYFPQAPFVKTTGDGLLIVVPCTRENLGEAANQMLHGCMEAHEAFPSLCADESMINFRVPQKIGIGLSRGAVSRIVANGGTLDYSGRVLNLASRLMNLARPSGIVFDVEYVRGLQPPLNLEPTFSKARVWLWGLAESEPIEVYYSKAYGTSIPAMYKRRLDVRKWMIEKGSWSFESLESKVKSNLSFGFVLDREPRDPEEIVGRVLYPSDIASRTDSYCFVLERELFEYELEGGEARIKFNIKRLVDKLRKLGFLSKHKCTFEFKYPR